MTMTMTNAQFDNDTYTLFTQEYAEPDGRIVHADEVPVTVRAKDFSFNGSGLLMYWNDVDKQLKSLEIAHGTDLTVYNAGAFSTQSCAGGGGESSGWAGRPRNRPGSGRENGHGNARGDGGRYHPAPLPGDVFRSCPRDTGGRRTDPRRPDGRGFHHQQRWQFRG